MQSKKSDLVGGEPAQAILDLVRSFPIRVDYAGRITLDNTATGDAAEMFARAYERVELDLLEAEQHCEAPWEHSTMDAYQHWWMVMTALMWQAKQQTGQAHRVEALWNTTWQRPIDELSPETLRRLRARRSAPLSRSA